MTIRCRNYRGMCTIMYHGAIVKHQLPSRHINMTHCEIGWAQPQLSWASSCCRSLVFTYELVWDGLTSRLTFYISVQTWDDRSGCSAENKNSLCLSCVATHWHVQFGLGFVFCYRCPIIRQERTFSQQEEVRMMFALWFLWNERAELSNHRNSPEMTVTKFAQKQVEGLKTNDLLITDLP